MSIDPENTDKTGLAEERTDSAEDRAILASEPTFAGWVRTGLASVAVALGLHALFDTFEPTWIPKLLASGRDQRRERDHSRHGNFNATLSAQGLTAGAQRVNTVHVRQRLCG